jgi:alpha-D-ribose 1-methylphosphonate 5-phosphate C-P lyase
MDETNFKMSDLTKKEKQQVQDVMANRHKYYEQIEQELQLLMSDNRLPEPMYYLMVMEVCFRKMARNVNQDTFFETIEASANQAMYEADKSN